MADVYEATGGLRWGGEGEFRECNDPCCNLFLNDDGLMEQLDLMSARWEKVYRMGLFKNDWTFAAGDTILQVDECDFDGYVGLQFTRHWTPAVMQGPRAITTADLLTWIHSGGPVANLVYGYFVVNKAGDLMWAERFCRNPLLMDSIGQRVRVEPVYTLKNDCPR